MNSLEGYDTGAEIVFIRQNGYCTLTGSVTNSIVTYVILNMAKHNIICLYLPKSYLVCRQFRYIRSILADHENAKTVVDTALSALLSSIKLPTFLQILNQLQLKTVVMS